MFEIKMTYNHNTFIEGRRIPKFALYGKDGDGRPFYISDKTVKTNSCDVFYKCKYYDDGYWKKGCISWFDSTNDGLFKRIDIANFNIFSAKRAEDMQYDGEFWGNIPVEFYKNLREKANEINEAKNISIEETGFKSLTQKYSVEYRPSMNRKIKPLKDAYNYYYNKKVNSNILIPLDRAEALIVKPAKSRRDFLK